MSDDNQFTATDDDLAIEGNQFKTTEIATLFNCEDLTRVFKALGGSTKHVISFSLASAPASPNRVRESGTHCFLELTVKRYVTLGEMRALAEELEANPPTKKEPQ